MFLDPTLRLPMLRVARRVAQKKLGMRYLMDVIPLDAHLVKGSHGLVPTDPRDGAVFLASVPFEACGGEPEGESAAMHSVRDRVLAVLEGGGQ
jgi:hypothetical protein